MSWFKTFFGTIFDRGDKLDLKAGVNFAGGLKATTNAAEDRIDVTLDGELTSGVQSFAGRSGIVEPELDDYSADQVAFSPTTEITADNVQDAIEQAAGIGQIESVGIGESLVADPSGQVKGLRAGTNVSLVPTTTDVQINIVGEAIPQPGVYGEIYVATPQDTTFLTSGPTGRTKLNGVTLLGEHQDWDSPSDGVLRYVGGSATFIDLKLNLTLTKPASGTNNYTIFLYRNGAEISEQKAASDREMAAGDVASISIGCLTAANPTDEFEVWIQCNDGTDTVQALKYNYRATVSGGSPAGYDYYFASKDDLIELSASYVGGVITLNPGSYFGTDDADLSEGGTSTDYIQMVPGSSISSSSADRCVIVGNNTGSAIKSPVSGSWTLHNVTVQNDGTGSAVEDQSDASDIALVEGVTLVAAAGGESCILVSDSSILVLESCILFGGTHQVYVTGSASAVTCRNGGYSNSTNAICVAPGAFVGVLAWTAQSSLGSKPTNACISNEGTIGHLVARNGGLEGSSYGIQNVGTITASIITSNDFNGGASYANAIVGISPSAQPVDGSPQGAFHLLKANKWHNLSQDEQSELPESPSSSAYATAADLRAAEPAKNAFYETRGALLATDGGGGPWRAVTGAAPDTYVDNIGTVIVPSTGPSSDGSGAFLRVYGEAVDPRWFGAKNDGSEDATAALTAAQDWAFRNPDPSVNEEIAFSAGVYLFTQSNPFGQWNGSGRSRVKFSGSAQLVLRTGGTGADWFYDGGTGIDQQLQKVTFEGLGFFFDETGKTGGSLNGFKVYPNVDFPSQSFQFNRCEFNGASAVTYRGIAFRAEGATNASENTFDHCKFRTLDGVVYCDNEQSVNWTFTACDAELIRGDVLHFASGVQLIWTGGSLVFNPEAASYILRSAANNGNFTFSGVRCEFRNTDARILNSELGGTASIAFNDCHFGVTVGGDRESFRIRPNAATTVRLSNCVLAGDDGQHLARFTAPSVANFWVSARDYARLELFDCKVPLTIHDSALYDAGSLALFRVRGGVYRTSAATGVPGVALDCDLTNQGFAPRGCDGPQLKTHWGYVFRWPGSLNAQGDDSRVQLPPGATLKGVYVSKTQAGASGEAYQLALANDDGSRIYAVSAAATYNQALTISPDPIWLHASASVDRLVRITPTQAIAYTAASGGFTPGETLTGGTSGTVARVAADSGSDVAVVLWTGAFTPGETLTGGTSGTTATAGATTDRSAPGSTETMQAGDVFAVEYV